ncbi:MAG: rRNA adenine methyltransferase [Anaerolineae bacterium]|nr:rRNA adenine methyltransferase [Anaerolineae bacterium]
MTARDWARLWAPYDASTYQEALGYVNPGDRVLDIGAGDLRFAYLVAQKGCTVYAIEQQIGLLCNSRHTAYASRIHVMVGDARYMAFPEVDVAILLMRHCADFARYVTRLRQAGCGQLVTNARWRMGVECMPLATAIPFKPERSGWQACVQCGRVHFHPCEDPARAPENIDSAFVNVEGCPDCMPHLGPAACAPEEYSSWLAL